MGGPATIASPAADDYSLTVASLTMNLNSGLVIDPGVNLLIGAGGYVNDNGRITLNSDAANSNTGLGINGPVTLEGTGNLILNAVPGGSLFTANIYGASTLTQNSGHTISGTGQITVASFTNYGTLNANSSGNTLLMQYSIAGTFANNGTFEATNGGTRSFGSGLFTNSGTILADGGNVLLNGYTNLTSTGLMQSINGGSLELISGTIINTGGTIEANGGSVLLNGGTITGGTLTSVGNNEIDQQGVTYLTNVTLSAGSNLKILDGSHAYVASSNGGTATVNGTVTVNKGGSNANTSISIGGAVDFTGTGSVILNGFAGNVESAWIADLGNSNLTQDSGHTISGTGTISVDNFTNNGTVNANSSGNTLLLQTNSLAYTNNSVWEATGGGTLSFGPGTYDNAGSLMADGGVVEFNGYTTIANTGTMQAGNGGALDAFSATITNTGTMRADNGGSVQEFSASITNTGGTIEANGGSVLLNGGTVTGGALTSIGNSEIDQQGITYLTNITLSAGSNLKVLDGSHMYFSANGSSTVTTTNNGTITVNKGGTNVGTGIGIGGTVDLSGTGSIILNGYAGNSESAWIYDIANSNLTQDSGHTISGGGMILVDNFTNNGTVNADASGNTLLLETNGTAYTNNGTYEATSGGTLYVTTLTNVSSGTLTGGTYQVNASSTMILPGTITTNAATIVLNGANASFAAISTLTSNKGTIKLLNGASFTTAGDLINSGTISLDPSTLNVTGNLVLTSSSVVDIGLTGTQAGQYDTIHVTGSATLAGTLSLNLASGFTASVGESFNFISADGGITGAFTNAGPIDVNGYVFDLTPTSNGLGLQVTATPEPGTLAFVAMAGSLGLLARRRKRG